MPVEVKSLSTVDDADTYFNNRLFSVDWTVSSADDKQRALNDATRIINLFNYIGTKTSPTQNDEFPRLGIIIGDQRIASDVIPSGILIAQYEIALALVQGIDPEKEIRSLFVTSRGYSSARITYDPSRIPEHLMHGVPSALAWSYLSTYLNRTAHGVVKLHRV